jgi:hypothetical protein
MKRYLALVLILAATSAAHGRGFGGGGGGGGFHGGGGFGGGGFHGGFGGGGFGGGGYHGGNFGGFHGSEFSGFHGGEFGGGGYGGSAFRGGGFNGGQFGGDGIRGAGGLAGDGFRGAGGAGGFDRGGFNNFGQAGGYRGGEFGGANRGFNSFDGMRSGSLPTASRLNSFLGLPTDMGMHSAGSTPHPFGYTGDARGLSAFEPAAGGERGASGREWTGPNGTTIAHGEAGERGAAVGPRGAAAGERGARGTVVEGPNGTTIAHGEAGERGAAVGPSRAAGGSRAASGTVIHGPNGGTIAHGSAVTRNWSSADMRVHGNYVRNNFNNYNVFNRGWYDRHRGAWWGGYAAGFWAGASWAGLNSWFGEAWPVYGYWYGNDLTYVDNNVCLYGEPIATADQYYQSAVNLVQTGADAQVPNTQPSASNSPASNAPSADWLPLGVFEAIPPDDKSSKMLMQLAVNKQGIIRGNYFNTSDDNSQLIEGSVDKKTARAAWSVADKTSIVFDTGLYNLTQDESPVLVHIGKDKNEQWTLVRLKQKPQSAANN